MQKIFLSFLLVLSIAATAQTKDETTIRNLLQQQTEAWNRGDLEGFMQTYWQSDSLMFIGKSGVVRGWQPTLDNYKKNYASPEQMGKLSFDIIQVKKLSKNYYHVVGKWMLKRTVGDLSGHYTLVIEKIKGRWKITHDHSS